MDYSSGVDLASVYCLRKMVYRQFRDKLRTHSFDVIHRISPISQTLGSPLASLTKVPMLIGPLNGGLPWPTEYPELRAKEREWLVPLRGLYRYLPYHRSTYRCVRGVIAGSWHTASEIPTWFSGRRYYVPENGVDPERIPLGTGWHPRDVAGRFRFVTVGRLVPYKGFDLVLQALSRSEELRREAELLIIGDGPYRTALEEQVSELESRLDRYFHRVYRTCPSSRTLPPRSGVRLPQPQRVRRSCRSRGNGKWPSADRRQLRWAWRTGFR